MKPSKCFPKFLRILTEILFTKVDFLERNINNKSRVKLILLILINTVKTYLGILQNDHMEV